MSLFTALGMYLGSKGQTQRAEKQAASQNAYQQGQQGIEQQRLGMEQQNAEEQKRLNDATLRSEGVDPATGQPIPYKLPPLPTGPKGAPASPEQLSNFYLQQAGAVANTNPALAAQYKGFADSYGLNSERNALAGLNQTRGKELNEGKIPLEQAQTSWWKQRHSEVMQQLQARMQMADSATRARMATAQFSARTRLQASGLSNDEREYIATLTGLNAAGRQDSTQAFNEAMGQYRTASTEWQNQQKQYLKSGNAPPGFDPASPPQAQTFIDNIQPSAPNVVNVSVTLPDGSKRTIPVPQPSVPHTRPDPAKIQKAKSLIEQSRAHGYADEDTVRKAQEKGYTPDEIKAAMKGALPMQGGGF